MSLFEKLKKLDQVRKILQAEKQYYNSLDWDGVQRQCISLTEYCLEQEFKELIIELQSSNPSLYNSLDQAFRDRDFENEIFRNMFRMLMLGFAVGCGSIQEYSPLLNDHKGDCVLTNERLLIRNDLYDNFWFKKFGEIFEDMYQVGNQFGKRPEFLVFGQMNIYSF
jgi:hypothetical protein